MTDTTFREPDASLVTITNVTYALHALGLAIGAFGTATVVGAFLFGWPSIIAVIINYVKRDEARGTWLESHITWQIRTFWFALLWAVVIGCRRRACWPSCWWASPSGSWASSPWACGPSTASPAAGWRSATGAPSPEARIRPAPVGPGKRLTPRAGCVRMREVRALRPNLRPHRRARPLQEGLCRQAYWRSCSQEAW